MLNANVLMTNIFYQKKLLQSEFLFYLVSHLQAIDEDLEIHL